MIFGATWFLLGVAFLPMLGALWWRRNRASAVVQRVWTGPRSDVRTRGRTVRVAWRPAIFSAAAIAACVALSRPQGPESESSVHRRGVDLVIVLDVSRSMLARDVDPDRLSRAKRDVRVLVDRAEGDRIGLVAFSGEARLMIPLTADRASFLEILEEVDPYVVTRGGTDLGAAIDRAAAALATASGEHESIVLLTDGEDLSGEGANAARRAGQRGLTVHAVGYGTTEGAKIPVTEDAGSRYVQDATGRDVVSALVPASLRAVVDSAGGTLRLASSSARPLVDLYEGPIASLARKAMAADSRSSRPEWFVVPLLVAYLLWILDACRWSPGSSLFARRC